VDWLYHNRETIRNEASKTGSLALATLIEALQTVRRIPYTQEFNHLASARELYERSSTLQRIPEVILNDPVETVDWLYHHRKTIRNEASKSGSMALVTLIYALQSTRRITYTQKAQRLASARDLYERSSMLQSIPEEILGDPLTVVDWLCKNRETIVAEASENKNLALATLTAALQAAKKIPYEQTLQRLASARDLYERSSMLQSIPEEILNDPLQIVDWLYENREAIQTEASQGKRLALGTLVNALQAAKRIPAEQRFSRLASGRELYDRSSILQKIPEEILNDPIKVANWLHQNREAIQTEALENKGLALATLTEALQAARRVPYDQRFHRLASARDLYDRSITLQGIPEEILIDPLEVTDWLHKNRETIRTESSESENLALISLMDALQVSKRIPFKQTFRRLAAGRDFYDKTPVLHGGKEKWDRIEEIIKFIDARRQDLLRMDKKDRVSYAYVVTSLEAARRIGPEVNKQILRYEAAAADYARKFERVIKDKIRSAVKAHLQKRKATAFDVAMPHRWTRFIDRSDLMNTKGNKLLSASYIATILKWARRLYGDKEALRTAEDHFTSQGR
jgi:flagellar biosynthesis protein FlhB